MNEQLKVVFPAHPRTRQRIEQFGLDIENLHLLEPLPYIEFLSLLCRAAVVITDSGGMQEETTFLGVPCLTLRSNTERPVTVHMGTNVLVGQDPGLLQSELAGILEGKAKKGSIPPLWDGHAGERIAEAVLTDAVIQSLPCIEISVCTCIHKVYRNTIYCSLAVRRARYDRNSPNTVELGARPKELFAFAGDVSILGIGSNSGKQFSNLGS